MAKGAARSHDHNLQIHAIWHLAAVNRIGLWVERVASGEDIADEPSREDSRALQSIGAKWVPPTLPEQLWQPQRWAQLSL